MEELLDSLERDFTAAATMDESSLVAADTSSAVALLMVDRRKHVSNAARITSSNNTGEFSEVTVTERTLKRSNTIKILIRLGAAQK